jgi:hypothetical protein
MDAVPMVRMNFLTLTPNSQPCMTHPLPGHVQQLTTQMTHLGAFSHVVECVFLLQQDNVISHALLDSLGESDKQPAHNICTLYGSP